MKKNESWKQLTDQEQYIIEHKGTEQPFSGTLLDEERGGIYLCKRCSTPLFLSESKFESHCGRPSFDQSLDSVHQVPDRDGQRTEIVCKHCGGHLGHVFEGERLTSRNTRHCVNSLSLDFTPLVNDGTDK